MKIGVVSDIHGNAAALRRAFRLLDGADRIVCLGDAINQYRFCNDTVELLRAREAIMVNGNHEETFFGRGSERARAAAWIRPELAAWLAQQPGRRDLELAGRKVLVCHATPWASGWAYVTPSHPEFRRFGACDADVVLYGHTHRRVAVRAGDALVVNPGSTGESSPGPDGAMSCAMVDLSSLEAQHFEFDEACLQSQATVS